MKFDLDELKKKNPSLCEEVRKALDMGDEENDDDDQDNFHTETDKKDIDFKDKKENRKPSEAKKSANIDDISVDIEPLVKSMIKEQLEEMYLEKSLDKQNNDERLESIEKNIAKLEKKLAEPVGKKAEIENKGEEKLNKSLGEQDLQKAIDGAKSFMEAYKIMHGVIEN